MKIKDNRLGIYPAQLTVSTNSLSLSLACYDSLPHSLPPLSMSLWDFTDCGRRRCFRPRRLCRDQRLASS